MITDSDFELICQRIEEGESITAVCKETGMPSVRCFYRALTDQNKQQRYARAREVQMLGEADRILDVASDKSLTPEDRRVEVDARKWRASKLAPKRYGDRLDVTSGDKPLMDMDPERVAARVAELMARAKARVETA